MIAKKLSARVVWLVALCSLSAASHTGALAQAVDAPPAPSARPGDKPPQDAIRQDSGGVAEMMLKSGVLFFNYARTRLAESIAEYRKLRLDMIELGQRERWGRVRLNPDEELVSQYMRRLRTDVVSQFQGSHFLRQSQFPPAQPFPLVKHKISELPSFEFIQSMPKGGLLHVHSSAMGQAEWIADHVGDYDGCYVYWPESKGKKKSREKKSSYLRGQINFFWKDSVPPGFVSAAELSHREGFREAFIPLLVMEENDFSKHAGIDPWVQFGQTFQRIGGFVSQQPAFRDYYMASLRALAEDGIQYVEIRSGITLLRELKKPVTGDAEFVRQFISMRDEIREDFPAFDLKLIITYGRGESRHHVLDHARRVVALRNQFKDTVIGYDLVGAETMDNQTVRLISVWMQLRDHESEHRPGDHFDLPLYFHDGETDWADNPDVVDALLLGSRRIGHGFNLVAYPQVERELLKRRIAVEVCPISNQMLRYVRDLRIHPASGYIRRGVPCVLGSDDPLIFGNHGLSYDFWVAWMAWDLQLADLKKLALNSLLYSGLTEPEKRVGLEYFDHRWNAFIEDVKPLARLALMER